MFQSLMEALQLKVPFYPSGVGVLMIKIGGMTKDGPVALVGGSE